MCENILLSLQSRGWDILIEFSVGSILGMSSKQILELSSEGENDPSYREKVVQRWYVYDMKILDVALCIKGTFKVLQALLWSTYDIEGIGKQYRAGNREQTWKKTMLLINQLFLLHWERAHSDKLSQNNLKFKGSYD